MGFNVQLGCHDCRVALYVLRGEESQAIPAFEREHPDPHRREIRVDNGWSDPDEFPSSYRSEGCVLHGT